MTGKPAYPVARAQRPMRRRSTLARDGQLGRRWSLFNLLAGTSVALIGFGALTVTSSLRAVPLTVAALALLAFDGCAAGILAAAKGKPTNDLPHISKAAVAAVLMGVPLLVHGLNQSALLSYGQFAVGTIGGGLVGIAWSRGASQRGWVDVGYMIFLTMSVYSLGRIFLENKGLRAFHVNAVLAWGASNFVAGVLVVGAFALIGAGRRALGVWVVSGAAITMSLLTLSRGALVAATAGGAALLWNIGRTSAARLALRTVALGAIGFAVLAFDSVTAARSVGGYDPESNVQARFHLFAVAWHQFLSSPITGTGWLALRDSSGFDTRISFAHNVVLSFLQMGGLCGAVYLGILVWAVRRSWRLAPSMRGALCAAVAISLTDPYWESLVGAMIGWAVLFWIPAKDTPADVPAVAEHRGPRPKRSDVSRRQVVT